METHYDLVNHDEEFDEQTKNQFEKSIASMGDIYGSNEKDQENFDEGYESQSKFIERIETGKISKKILNFNTELKYKHQHDINMQINNTLEINKLKPSKIGEPNRFSHVKNGIINPPKKNNSIKPIYEDRKLKHEKDVGKIVLFASKIEIPNNNFERNLQRTRVSNEKKNQQTQNFILVNQPPSMNKSQNHKLVNRPKSAAQKHQKNLLQMKKEANSKNNRDLVKQVETIYEQTKKYFNAVNNNLPPPTDFKELIKESQNLESSLENFYKNSDKDKKMKRSKESPLKKSPLKKKEFHRLNIGEEQQRKLEEKLELLHVQTRQIFDSLARLEENDPKIGDLRKKSQELNNILKFYNEKHGKDSVNVKSSMKLYENMEDIINVTNPSILRSQNLLQSQNITNNEIFNRSNIVTNPVNISNNFNMNSVDIVNVNRSISGEEINTHIKNNQKSYQMDNIPEQPEDNYMKSHSSQYSNLKNSNFDKIQGNHPQISSNQIADYRQSQELNFNQSHNNYLKGSKFGQSVKSVVFEDGRSSNSQHDNHERSNLSKNQQSHGKISSELLKSRITLSSPIQPEPIITNEGVLQDDRYTSYNIQLPVDYYLNYAKEKEPKPSKEWYLRPHHLESFTKNQRSIPDDILNTKYISYYSPPNIQHPVTRQEQLDGVIDKLQKNIDDLKKDFYVKMMKDKNLRMKYEEMEKMQEELKKNYKPGQIFEDFNKENNTETSSRLAQKQTNYSDFFNKNEKVQQTNLVIKTYETLLNDLRSKEKMILNEVRKKELEKIRPPKEKWWEDKTRSFQKELNRNRAFLNANGDYFVKLEELQDNELY